MPTREEIRKLQLLELEMLKEVLRICREHQLTYYALGGTLLGAVRHKGFIPWDDDIDIGIPRPDYEKFLKIAADELPDHLQVDYFKTEDRSLVKRPSYACKIRNLNVDVIERIANIPNRTKAWIDIFPLDGVPGNWLLRKIHSFRMLYRRMRIQFSMFDENVHTMRSNRPWYEKALIKFYRITRVGRNSDPYDMMYRMDEALTRYDYDSCSYLINFMGAWKLKELFPKSVYGDGKEYPFEDLLITGPADADYVLKQMYGDYMTPPPDSENTANHHALELIDNVDQKYD